MEVARVLHKKIYVGAAKLRLLECLEYPKEDMQWLTLNEHESHIHVVPMWTLASFKRLKHVANQYAVSLQIPCFRFLLILLVIEVRIIYVSKETHKDIQIF